MCGSRWTGEVKTTPEDGYHSVENFQQFCELDPVEKGRVKDLFDRLRALTFSPFDNAHIEVNGGTRYVDVETRPESDDSDPDGLLSSY